MPSSPAGLLSQALSGTGKAASYGGYNPFAAQSATVPDAGQQAQQQVQQNQTDYQSQQDSSKAQLFASLAPSSIGGEIQSNGQDLARNANPAGNSIFSNTIASINQRGVDATQVAQQQAAAAFAKKMSTLNSQYFANSQALAGDIQSFATGADPNSNMGARAVALAQQVVKNNVPYVWGGNSLTKGVDCSGLVQQIYAQLGIHLPRTSTEQAKYGKIVPNISQALPGDLILMYSPYEPAGLQQYGHVGIYIGNGLMIDAAHSGTVVRIEKIVNMTRIVRPW
jgi:cell wall-associated NlpC family hydrolase